MKSHIIAVVMGEDAGQDLRLVIEDELRSVRQSVEGGAELGDAKVES